MKKRNRNKFFASLLAFLLLFSLFNPAFSLAESSTLDPENGSNISEMKELVVQQERLLEREAFLHPDLQMLSGEGEVNVIVQLSEAPVGLEKGKKLVQGRMMTNSEEASVLRKVNAQQAFFEKELESNKVKFAKGFTYNYALNGMAITVKESDLEKILEIDGVVSVEPDNEYHTLEDVTQTDTVSPLMDTSNDYLGVNNLWAQGYEGEGVKVAVLDTGIDYDHPDFEGIYKGGYNFVPHDGDDRFSRPRDDDDPYETSPLDRSDGVPEFNTNGSSFYTTHGTHVAGTIAAIGVNEYGIKGIAPKIDLYAYRVLGAYGSGQFSWILAGIDQAVEDEMDIINLSLGGGSNNSTIAEAASINNAAIAGVTSVLATGNSGPGRGTIGAPAVSAFGIAVGNSTLPEPTIETTVSVQAGDYTSEYSASFMGWEYASDPEEDLVGTLDVITVPEWGSVEDYDGLDVEGKIALVSRGEIPFVDKIAAAKNAGAVGMFIHNNIADAGPADILLGDSFNFIPTLDISTADGEALRAAIDGSEEGKGVVSFNNFNRDVIPGDHVNSSSSRGPTTPYFDIKPDVVAPGTNIMSTMPAFQQDFPDASFDKAFDRKTGTSMAAPHIAGIAALLLSANPDWSPFDLKVAMSNTAKQLDTSAYDVFAQGPGRVQPTKAVSPQALAYVEETIEFGDFSGDHEKGTVTFGSIIPDPEEATTITREIDVRSFIEGTSEFEVTVQTTRSAIGDMTDANVSVDKSSFTLDDEETIEVTLTVPSGEGNSGNELLGYIHITSDTTELLLPFAAEFTDGTVESGLAYYYLDDYAISSNGTPNETNINFGLYNDHGTTFIELWDASNPNGGYYGDGYLGYYIATASVPAGAWYLPIDETYTEWGSGEVKQAPDGVYTVDFTSINPLGGETLAWDGPFYIKSSEPVLQLDEVFDDIDVSEMEITGAVDDKFIDFKGTVESIFGLPYDVNDMLSVEYELTNAIGYVVDRGQIPLEQDGTFELAISDLTNGENELTITVNDVVDLSVQETIEFEVTGGEDITSFNINLSQSPEEATYEPVSISVDTDSTVGLVALKWLDGEKTVEDFENAGTDIPLDTKTFEVIENGEYTVYAQNAYGVEEIQTIQIENILDPPPISITLTSDPTDPIEGPVTIVVEVDTEVDVEELKWLKGEKSVEDFEGIGQAIDLELKSFEVTENGTYTVYGKNIYGLETVGTIEVDNILASISLELSPSTSEPTEGPVTITIDVDTEVDVEELKWLEGDRSKEDFVNNGVDIDLDTKSFEVTNNGSYTVYGKNSDGVEAIQSIVITNIVDPAAPISINLTPSTEEFTVGPLSIFVDVDTEAEVTSLQWLEGNKTVEDFAEAGYDIDLEVMSFEVTENGVYTVYAKNSDDVEEVRLVAVENIVDPITISYSSSTTEPTEDPVTINLELDSDAEINSLKWLAGEMSLEDFADAGTDISLGSKSFEVTENGTYTVYAQNIYGIEAVLHITIDNIVEPQSPEPEPINISLTPSTTEPTEGPVTIAVETDHDESLVVLKWLKGEHSKENFADYGNDILYTKYFDVTENGIYTVYAMNELGVEAIQTIEINNIVDSDGEKKPVKPEKPKKDKPKKDKDDKKPKRDKKQKPRGSDKSGAEGESDDKQVKGDEALPDTATSSYNYLVLGLLILMMGTTILFFHYRKARKENV